MMFLDGRAAAPLLLLAGAALLALLGLALFTGMFPLRPQTARLAGILLMGVAAVDAAMAVLLLLRRR